MCSLTLTAVSNGNGDGNRSSKGCGVRSASSLHESSFATANLTVTGIDEHTCAARVLVNTFRQYVGNGSRHRSFKFRSMFFRHRWKATQCGTQNSIRWQERIQTEQTHNL